MADCQPAYNFCSFLPLSYFFPNFLFSSFLVLVLPSFSLSVSFLSCLVFPSLFLSFFLSFFLVLVFLFPVCLVCQWCASSRTFLFHIYFFTRMYSYVTRMPLVWTRMWLVCLLVCTHMYSYVIGVYPYVLVCYSYVVVCYSYVFQAR